MTFHLARLVVYRREPPPHSGPKHWGLPAYGPTALLAAGGEGRPPHQTGEATPAAIPQPGVGTTRGRWTLGSQPLTVQRN